MSLSTSTTPISTTGPGSRQIIRWPSIGTPEQLDDLADAQVTEAINMQEAIDKAVHWYDLYELIQFVLPSQGGSSDEQLPAWLIEGFHVQIRSRMATPIVGTPSEWASLSPDDHFRMRYILELIVGPGPDGYSRIQVRGLVVDAVQGVGAVPVWAKQKLLDLFDSQTTKKDTKATVELHHQPEPAKNGAESENQVSEGSTETNPATARTTTNLLVLSEEPAVDEKFRVHLAETWPPGFWGIPNLLVHNALFSATKGNPGYYGATVDDLVSVPSLSHSTIEARGHRLTEWHLDALMTLMDLGKSGDEICTTPRALLNSMDRGHSTRDVYILVKALQQLARTFISISVKFKNSHTRRKWSGTLIQHFDIFKSPSGSGQCIRVVLDPTLGHFLAQRWTFVRIPDRARLRRSPIASALHAAYSQHVDASIPYPIETVRKLLGVEVGGADFLRRLKNALCLLQSSNLIAGWTIEKDGLRIMPIFRGTKVAWFAGKDRKPTIVSTAVVSTASSSKTLLPPAKSSWQSVGNGFALFIRLICRALERTHAAIVGSRKLPPN
jgi:hypothetical protein